MAAPAIGRRRRFAPGPGVRIDWDHPVAQGLRFCTLPAYPVDLVNGYRGTSTAAVGRSSFGASADFVAAASQIDFGAGPVLGGGGGVEWSAFGAGRMRTAAANAVVVCKRSAFSNGNDEFCLNVSGDGRVTVTRAGDFTNIVGANVTGGTQSVIGATCSATTVTGYVNGAASTVSADRRSNNSPNATIGVGRLITEAGDGFNDGALAIVGVWNRVLSPNEFALITDDPFCFLRS